jgi:hypothetical protein
MTQDKNAFPSMEAAASAKGFDKNLLKIAKRMGADGFRQNNGIYWPDFEKWYADHESEVLAKAEAAATKWKQRKERADALLAELKLEGLQGRYVDKEQVKTLLRGIAGAQKALLRGRLCDELPPRLLGLGVVEMTVIMDEVVQEVCKLFEDAKLDESDDK